MYSIPHLLQYQTLYHSISEKSEGNMANAILGQTVNFKEVLNNRRKFLDKNNINIDKCIAMWVEGGDGVKVADPNDAGKSMKDYNYAVRTDALITDKRNLYLFLLVADCAPVILYDPLTPAVGLVHVGWKGADLDILGKTIEILVKEYNTRPERLIAGIGPSARKDSFIKENPAQLVDPKWKMFLRLVNENKYKVDFVGLAISQLRKSGVKEENIYDSQKDTITSKNFFSHYRESNLPLSKQGRFACLVGLK